MAKTKKLLSLLTAAAISASAFSAMVFPAYAEEVPVLTQNFDGELVNGDTYTYGTGLNIKNGALLLTNSDNAENNYDADLVTFTEPLGDTATAVNISYTAALADKGKGQDATNFDTVYFDETGAEMFRFRRLVGDNWQDTLSIVVGDQTVACTGINVDAQVVFNRDGAGGTVTMGTSSAAFANGTGIAKIGVSVNAARDYGRGINIDNLAISTDDAPVMANVTINYVDAEGNAITESAVRTVTAGTTYTATDADKAAIFADGVKYVYDADATESDSVAVTENGAELTLVYKAADLYDVTVTAKGDDEADLCTVYTGQIYDGETVTAPYPRYIASNGALYMHDATDKEYNHKFTVNADAQSSVLTYAKQAETAVYYAEAEDILDDVDVSNANVRCSMGDGGAVALDESKTVVNLSAGTYKVSSAVWGSEGATYNFVTNGTTQLTLTTTGSWLSGTSEEFTLTEAADLVITCTAAASSATCVDYVLITGTGTATVPEPEEPIVATSTFDEDVAIIADGQQEWTEGSLAGWFANVSNSGENTLQVTGGVLTSNVSGSNNKVYFGKHVTTIADAADKKITIAFDYQSNSGTATGNNASEIGFIAYDGNDVTWSQAYNGAGVSQVAADYGMTDTEATYEVTVVIDNTANTATLSAVSKGDETAEPVVTELAIGENDINTFYFRTGRGKTDTIDNVVTTVEVAGETPVPSTEPEETPVPSTEPEETPVPTEAPTPVPVDPKAVIDFTNRTLTYESKGSSTVFEVVSADTIAPALAAAGAGDVLQLGSNQNGASKMLGYKATFAKEGEDVVVYSGQVTMSFKLELNQVRTDKDASIELSFADINGTPILPITVGTGNSAYLTVNGVSASNIAYGSYYVVTYTMDFDAKTASVTIADAAGNSCLDTGSVAIEAENITQLYRADSDWLYGYVIIDDIKLDATNIGVPKFYTITINTERYAKLTTDVGDKYFADVNGKIEIPLQTPGTTFGYTISKVGYTDVTGTIEPLTEDVVIDQPITKADENVIFIESEFGNENEAYVSLGGNRNDTVSLGEIALPDISEIAVDFEFAGFGNYTGQQKTWYISTDAGELVGIQINDNGLIAWTGWTGAANHNQSSDIGAFANSEKIGEMPSGAFTIKFVVDKANKAITVLYNDASYSLPYTIDATKITGLGTGLYRYNGELKTTELRIVEPDKEFMQLSGDTNFAKISGKTVTRSYIKSESVITPDETFTWTVANAAGEASEAVTISQDGVLSVTDAAVPGVYTITCTGSTGKTASLDVTVQDFATVTPTVDGPKTYTEGQTGTYVVTALVDQYGDDVFGLFAPSFESSNTDVITIDAATGVATAVANGSADITITIGNPGKEAKVTIPVTVDTYYVTADATGDSTVVDISAIVNKGNGTYQVTTTNNGVIVNQYIADAEDITAGGTVMALEADATAYTAIYNEDGTLQSVSTFNAPKGYVEEPWAIENAERYYWDNNMKPVNFVEMASEASITVDTTGADKVEIAPVYEAELDSEILVPNDRYNITVSASGRRTDFYVNDQLFINNINQGSDNWTIGRIFPETTVKTVEDVVIGQGYAVFNLQDNAGATVNGITFVKAPSTVERQQRIYVIGDSLVADYYGDAPAGQEGLVRTGWGQVLDSYIVDSVGVTNLGNSGADAVGMRNAAFTNVIYSAQPGDILVLESGYNDDNAGDMSVAVNYMIETAYDMGLKTYLVTPNASSHGTGQKPDVKLSGTIRELAAALGEKTTLIDLAQESYDFLTGLYTTDGVMNWDIVTDYYNNEGDKLHSSNNAANCWARIIAQGLYDSGLTEIVDTEYSYTFNDGIADRVIQVEAE